VCFLGFRRDVPALLAGSDGLVLPSWFDAFGNVVAEAMACGAPVIASASCGGSEWIREGENGFVLGCQDAGQLAERLRRLLTVEDLAPLRDAARRQAERHAWSDHVDAVLAIYAELAQHPQP
jgi:UDP-glucose:(heptosyl)LPS alpha-1,3-glucosyltransferase